jgi:hypothetical protein
MRAPTLLHGKRSKRLILVLRLVLPDKGSHAAYASSAANTRASAKAGVGPVFMSDVLVAA